MADPPFDKLGALPLETVYPRKERQQLMMALNNLLASPAFAAWRVGEPLDVGAACCAPPDGRPRLSIVYTAHLSDDERLFVTALSSNKVKTWVRQQSGTSTLRALVYIDEIFGYFPPHPANPPTKRPLLTLLKQARAQGVGIVLATQNPVDLDYKGLANMGLWLVGRLQTEQDRARLRDGLVGTGVDAAEIDRLLDATRKRVFLMHDVHRTKPVLVHSRWAMSYLRGPLTRDEIAGLTPDRGAAAPSGAAPRTAWRRRRAGRTPRRRRRPPGAPPVPSPGFPQAFFAVAGQGGRHAVPAREVRGPLQGRWGRRSPRAPIPLRSASLAELLEGDPITVEEDAGPGSAARAAALRRACRRAFAAATGRMIEKAIRDRLPDRLAVSVWVDPMTGATSAARASRRRRSRRGWAPAGRRSPSSRPSSTKKRRDLAAREEEMAGRKTEKWAALGSAVLTNVFGRGRGLSGASHRAQQEPHGERGRGAGGRAEAGDRRPREGPRGLHLRGPRRGSSRGRSSRRARR